MMISGKKERKKTSYSIPLKDFRLLLLLLLIKVLFSPDFKKKIRKKINSIHLAHGVNKFFFQFIRLNSMNNESTYPIDGMI